MRTTNRPEDLLAALRLGLRVPFVTVPDARPNLAVVQGLQQRGVLVEHQFDGAQPGPLRMECPVCHRRKAFIEPLAGSHVESIWCESGCDEALVTARVLAAATRPYCSLATDRSHYSGHCADCVATGRWASAEADARASEASARDASGWEPTNLADVPELSEPSVLLLPGGGALLTPGFLHGFHGRAESGKTRLLYLGVVEQVRLGNAALIIDYEMGPVQARESLIGLGLSPEQLRDQVVFIAPEMPLDERARVAVEAAVEATGRPLTLAIIDSVSESMTSLGLSDDNTNDVSAWLQALPRWIVQTWPTCAEAHIDHLAKHAANTLDPIGSQRKRAGVDVQYLVSAEQPFSRERDGYSLVTVSKHRAGTFARGSRVARLDGGSSGFRLSTVDADAQRAHTMNERVMQWIADAGAGWHRAADVRSGVTGDTAAISASLKRLVTDGRLTQRKVGRADEYCVAASA